MDIEAWDSVFVRARRRDVHPVLRDLPGYGRWWPGVDSLVTPHGHVRLVLQPPTVPARLATRCQRLTTRLVRERHDLGVELAYRGSLDGQAEWYYLDEADGTVVHYLLHARAPRHRWRRTLAEHRATVRAGLHELKDRLEAGRPPGAEPDPRLLADQRAAIAAWRARVGS